MTDEIAPMIWPGASARGCRQMANGVQPTDADAPRSVVVPIRSLLVVVIVAVTIVGVGAWFVLSFVLLTCGCARPA